MPNNERLQPSPLGPSKLQRQQAVQQQGLGPGRGHWPEVRVSRLSMCRDHMSGTVDWGQPSEPERACQSRGASSKANPPAGGAP